MTSNRDRENTRNTLAGQVGRRSFLAAVGGTAGALMIGEGCRSASRRPPNIIVIVADDVGYGDVGCYGCPDIPTPNIDSMARDGVRFTDGYVSAPVCSPTRAGLMTGRYQHRFGHEYNPPRKRHCPETIGIPAAESTVATLLKEAGYATGIVGKWHLGFAAQFHPLNRGFDEFYGFLTAAHSYVNPDAPLIRGYREVYIEAGEYLTEVFTREATDFIERHTKKPFFLYLPYSAAHNPHQAPQRYLDRVPELNGKRKTYAAMTVALDDGVGAVLDKLRETGLEQDTLVVFLSDNGGTINPRVPQDTYSRNDPLKGGKMFLNEGGIRVPFMMRWPGHIPARQVYAHPVISLDILPTAVAAVGGDRPSNVDGVDLLPYLMGRKSGAPHETLFWRQSPNHAVRKGNWKLVQYGYHDNSDVVMNHARLYNLAIDIGETNNVAGEHPDIVKELDRAYQDWERRSVKALWQSWLPLHLSDWDGEHVELPL